MFLGFAGARTLFLIHSICGVDIKAYSACPDEAEILLMPGTCLKVKGIFPDKGVTMVQMEEIHLPGLVDFARDQ